VLAFVGGGMYIFVTVWSILFGKRLDEGQRQARPTPLRLPVAEAIQGHGGGVALHEARGTFVLALVFLAAFVLYYFVNWKYLGSVWGLS
jgi:cytochrome c oxidase subunit 1